MSDKTSDKPKRKLKRVRNAYELSKLPLKTETDVLKKKLELTKTKKGSKRQRHYGHLLIRSLDISTPFTDEEMTRREPKKKKSTLL